MGQIRKLNNGSYQCDVRDKDGNRLRKNFKRRDEAFLFVSKVEEVKHQNRISKIGLVSSPILLDKFISDAIEDKKSLAFKSFLKYKRVYVVLEQFIQKKKLNLASEFNQTHADEFKEILVNSGVSAKTINFYLMAIRSVFKELVIRQNIEVNPFDHVKLERIRKKSLIDQEDDYYNELEVKSFFSVKMESNYRNAFLGLFLTGMRFGEFSSLKWERVDLVKKIIQIRSDKNFTTKTTSSERDIPMSNKLFKLIQKLSKSRTSEYVFTSLSNTKLSEKTLLLKCKEIASEAKIKKNATLHKWRHSFNSHLAQSGVDYTVRQYLLGHKPQTMTDHYTKVDPTKLNDQVSNLDHLINNEPTNE